MGDRISLIAIVLFLCISWIYCNHLEYKTFRCRNGTYISDHLVCDNKTDCINDGIDEHSSLCGSYSVLCGPEKLSYVTTRCNTREDCSIEQDEENCGDEVNTYDCELRNGKYLCQDGLRCLDFSHTCDGVCNCFDCSDEKSGCSHDGYADFNSIESSHQACFNTPKGPICCSEFDSTCQECDSNEICAHKCVQLGNKTGCICDENYIGVPGTKNAECFPISNAAKEKLLVFLSNNYIQALNLFTNTNFTVKNYPDGFGFWATALTAFQDHVYHVHSYLDAPPGKENQTGTIKDAVWYTSVFKTSITKNETHEIMKAGSEKISTKINSLAVDWITHNIYFATLDFILVCSNDCRICKQMKSDGATFINLASRRGLMFWVSADRSKLMKSSMDGSDQISIFNFNSTSKSNHFELRIDAMTVDELTERIYWHTHYDLHDNIHSVNFNGGKKEVRPLKFKLYYWKSEFTQLSNYLYWDMGIYYEEEFFFIMRDGTSERKICSIENRTNTLAERFPVPKRYGEDYKFRAGEYKPKMLYVYNPHLQFTKIRNPCPTSCAGLCLTRPSLSKGLLNYTCVIMRPTKFYNTGSNIRTETLKISCIVVMCGVLLRRYLNNYNSDMFLSKLSI